MNLMVLAVWDARGILAHALPVPNLLCDSDRLRVEFDGFGALPEFVVGDADVVEGDAFYPLGHPCVRDLAPFRPDRLEFGDRARVVPPRNQRVCLCVEGRLGRGLAGKGGTRKRAG